MHNFQIEMTGPNRGVVFMDGKKLEGVRGFEIKADVDSLTSVVLHLSATSLGFSATALFEVGSVSEGRAIEQEAAQ